MLFRITGEPYLCCHRRLTVTAHAGVVIDGTRHIYPQQRREITLRLSNVDKRVPRLVQVWLDQRRCHSRSSHSDVPFSLAPSVFLDQEKPGCAAGLHQDPLPPRSRVTWWLKCLGGPRKSARPNSVNKPLKGIICGCFSYPHQSVFRPVICLAVRGPRATALV